MVGVDCRARRGLIAAGWVRLADIRGTSHAGFTPVSAVEDKRLAQAPRLSVVVPPFATLCGDPQQDYFVDGLTDDLRRVSPIYRAAS
jgi:hypothetical protein